MNKKAHLLAFISLCTISCTTVPRPDMGVVKNNGKKYVYKQSKVLGLFPVKPRLVEAPSKMDRTQGILQLVGKWGLYVSLPLSILAAIAGGVLVTYLQDRKTAKLCMVGSIALFLTAMFFTSWLLATTYMWIFIPTVALFVSGAIYLLYKMTLGTTPKKLQELINTASP